MRHIGDGCFFSSALLRKGPFPEAALNATRFWAFQGIETGIYLVLVAALIALAYQMVLNHLWCPGDRIYGAPLEGPDSRDCKWSGIAITPA